MADYGAPYIYRVFDRTRRPGPPPVDLKSMVVQADPGWAKAARNPIIYVFSNNRGFSESEQPGQAYPWV